MTTDLETLRRDCAELCELLHVEDDPITDGPCYARVASYGGLKATSYIPIAEWKPDLDYNQCFGLIVKRMEALGYGFWFETNEPCAALKYRAVFHCGSGRGWRTFIDEDDDLRIAICKAALLALEGANGT